MSKTFKLKGYKKFCRVFLVFLDSYVLSLWTFDVRFTHRYIMAMLQFKKDPSGRPRLRSPNLFLFTLLIYDALHKGVFFNE